MLIKSIKLNNFLSFGDTAETVQLRPLNVIIGPNGSGKSNLLEAIDLLRNAPNELTKPIREGGGVLEWLWKGAKEKNPNASLDVNIECLNYSLDYGLVFCAAFDQRFFISAEKIKTDNDKVSKFFYWSDRGKGAILRTRNGEKRELARISIEKSIITQLRDPKEYPELSYLADNFCKIKLYREWSFGRYAIPRMPQKADMPNDMLESDASNLGLVLNRLRREPVAKKQLLTSLKTLSESIDDYDVRIEGGTVQVFFQEGNYIIPATRLSDGTLRYLCLLSILCHPIPPPLVCIEEPELGLHPDVLPALADLMKEASKRCQLIVTTHSDILVDAMTDQPESVLVCDKDENGTALHRLDAEQMKLWLEKYRLGELWISGQPWADRFVKTAKAKMGVTL